MFYPIIQTLGFLGTFMALDQGISLFCQNPYYLVHAVHNAMIVYFTAPDVLNTITDYKHIETYPTNMVAICLCFALHLYHTIMYYNKFRFDDWLHHILMIGLALPVPLFYEAHTLIGYSLFFTTGLPGGIDYLLLFGVRNGWIHRYTEKKINAWLNIWIRSPGCISHTAITCMSLYSLSIEPWSFDFCVQLMPALLVFWNGQYFMRQVVEDNALQQYVLQNHDL